MHSDKNRFQQQIGGRNILLSVSMWSMVLSVPSWRSVYIPVPGEEVVEDAQCRFKVTVDYI